MKICLFNHSYGPYARSGAEQVISALVEELGRDGHEVTVVALKPWFAQSPSQPARYLGAGFLYLDAWPLPVRLLYHVLNSWNIIKYLQIRSILRQEQPDLILTHNMLGFGLLSFRAIAHSGGKHSHTVHDIQLLHPSGLLLYGQEGLLDTIQARIYQAIVRRMIRSIKQAVFPSRWLEKLHLEHGLFAGSRRMILPNPTPVFPPALPEASPSDFIFLYVGQIEKHKGVSMLIDAFKDTAPAEARLIIVGEGSERKRLESATQDPRILFVGKKDRADVERFMRRSSCLVVPSLCYENYPTVILEAQAAGLPVIASDLGGIPELIENPTYRFAPEPEALRDALKLMVAGSLSRDPATRAPLSVAEYIRTLLK